MEQINFDLGSKGITVQNVFRVSPQSTNFKIIRGYEEVWSGTELKKCEYRNCEVSFMRVVGEPYTDGYIELRIEVDENEQ